MLASSTEPMADSATWRVAECRSFADLMAVAVDALRDGSLRTCLDDFHAPPLALYAIYPPTRHLAVKVRLFIDFLVKRFEG